MEEAVVRAHPEPWNKGKLVGQKAPFKLKEIWAIRVRLQLFHRARDLALFDLGIDSKLRVVRLCKTSYRLQVSLVALPQWTMCRPTRKWNRGRLKRLGETSEEDAQPLHRGSGGSTYTRKAYATREAPKRGQG